MTQLTFTMTAQDERLDKALVAVMANMSRAQLHVLFKEGRVQVNGQVVKANYRTKQADVVVVDMPEPTTIDLIPEDIPLTIVYEDDAIIVINKPAGMVVHPSKNHASGTLVNALLHHTTDLSTGTNLIRPGIVHRIDRDTSGLLVVAKTNAAHQHLAEQIQTKTMSRQYLALVKGVIQHERGTIDAPIARDKADRLRFTVAEDGKPAVTHFEVVERFDNATLVRLRLETGRTHQIRVHLRYINHAVLGDPVYGHADDVAATGQFLHAYQLAFTHPVTNEPLVFEADVPTEFATQCQLLKGINE